MPGKHSSPAFGVAAFAVMVLIVVYMYMKEMGQL